MTDEEGDALCSLAEKNVAIHLPTFAASRTTGTPKKQPGVTPLEALPTPTRAQLERHRRLFGSECVDLAVEKRGAKDLRADGLSVPEIARVLRVSESVVKIRLRLGAPTSIPAI